MKKNGTWHDVPCRVVMFASHGGVGAAAGVCPTKVFMGDKSWCDANWADPIVEVKCVHPLVHRNSRIKISFKEEQHDDCSGIGFV